MYDVLVFIGRFQPFHKGHEHIIREALKVSKNVIILVGSASQARDTRNPFTEIERMQVILETLSDAGNRIIIDCLLDYPYNDDKWASQVRNKVNNITRGNGKIGLIGFAKDHTSFYLRMFPEWDSIDIAPFKLYDEIINSTDLRQLIFEYGDIVAEFVPKKVVLFLHDFVNSPTFNEIKQEYDWNKKYKELWSKTPYPVIFQTVDNVVVQSGHVLLVERGAYPGKGQLALPGGYVNVNETLLQSAIRELREETKLKVPAKVLEGSIKETKVFDYPNRSMRGRVVTTAFYMRLEDQLELPKVKGSDDAAKAMWIPLSNLHRRNLFEDHAHIISHFTEVDI